MSTHPNSRKITIQRLAPFNHDAQKGLDDWFANANTSIGSYFKGKGSKRVETGLEDWEADILLVQMVNAESTDKDFKKKVEDYYVNINTKIPHDGLELEIGLVEDNNKVVTATNKPISIDDFLTYKHALLHPFLAKTKELGYGNVLAKFYIEDKTALTSELVKKEGLRDKALAKYLGVVKDAKKVSMYLSILGVNYKNITPSERPSVLKAKANDNPQLFIDTIDDKDAATRFFINQLVSANIITKEGNRYLLEGEQLGKSTKDFILYLADKANSETVGILKARLQEFTQ